MANELFEQLGKEYQEELKTAVEEAKEDQKLSMQYGGLASPIWGHRRIIAVFRKYWLKCDEYNKLGDSYYNPRWLIHDNLDGELYDIIHAMPYFPIGIDENGNYC